MNNRIILFGDIHFGHWGDSEEFNTHARNFIHDMCRDTDSNIKRCIFLGDWFHNRSHLRIDTLHMSVESMNMLVERFDRIDMIVGNHDMFFRDKRDVNSLNQFKKWKNVNVYDEVHRDGDFLFVPFLMKSEYPSLKEIEPTRIVFGHFEYAGFLTNQYRRMDNHGFNDVANRPDAQMILSGHFHKRQVETFGGTDVVYIGSPFGHDFNDANDFGRGWAVLDIPENPDVRPDMNFHDWEPGPRFHRIKMEDIDPNRIREWDRVEIIVENDEEYQNLNETDIDIPSKNVRVKPPKINVLEEETNLNTDGTIEDMIRSLLLSVPVPEDSGIDREKLVEIYDML